MTSSFSPSSDPNFMVANHFQPWFQIRNPSIFFPRNFCLNKSVPIGWSTHFKQTLIIRRWHPWQAFVRSIANLPPTPVKPNDSTVPDMWRVPPCPVLPDKKQQALSLCRTCLPAPFGHSKKRRKAECYFDSLLLTWMRQKLGWLIYRNIDT